MEGEKTVIRRFWNQMEVYLFLFSYFLLPSQPSMLMLWLENAFALMAMQNYPLAEKRKEKENKRKE